MQGEKRRKMKKMTIQEASRLTGLPASAIRYYTDHHLVPDLERDSDNNRIFGEQALNWLRAVAFFRSAGMPLKEISRFIELCQEKPNEISERTELLENLLADTKAKIEMLKNAEEILEEKIELMKSLPDHPEWHDSSNPLNWNLELICDEKGHRIDLENPEKSQE